VITSSSSPILANSLRICEADRMFGPTHVLRRASVPATHCFSRRYSDGWEAKEDGHG
jgi:hypothetical protein